VAGSNEELVERLQLEVRHSGLVACVARSAGGFLRVATAVGPDIVLLDSSMPWNLAEKLRAHPATVRPVVIPVSP
jgi:DNA-binding response OmpR family regulator